MQDNEMDDLFRSKLEDFQAEPSQRVWTGIRAELDQSGSRARSILPLLRIAAAVLVLATGGIIFIPWNKHAGKMAVQTYATRSSPAAIKPGQQASAISRELKPERFEKNASLAIHHTKNLRHVPKATAGQPLTAVPAAAELPGQTLELANSPSSDVKPVFTVSDITITEKKLIEQRVVSIPAQANAAEKPLVKKHGIHNIGDLVNLVVARVDKRKDKVIEFSDEDDESTITGLNIGLIRIKKDK